MVSNRQRATSYGSAVYPFQKPCAIYPDQKHRNNRSGCFIAPKDRHLPAYAKPHVFGPGIDLSWSGLLNREMVEYPIISPTPADRTGIRYQARGKIPYKKVWPGI